MVSEGMRERWRMIFSDGSTEIAGVRETGGRADKRTDRKADV